MTLHPHAASGSRTSRHRWSRWTVSPTRSLLTATDHGCSVKRDDCTGLAARWQQGAQARAALRRGAHRGLRHARDGRGPAEQPRSHDRGGRQPPRARVPHRARAGQDAGRRRRPRVGEPAARPRPRGRRSIRSSAAATTTSRRASRRWRRSWPMRDGRPFAIPVGGASVTGAAAYVHGADELVEQLHGVPVDWIVLGDGSGGTHAGLLAGLGTRCQCPRCRRRHASRPRRHRPRARGEGRRAAWAVRRRRRMP